MRRATRLTSGPAQTTRTPAARVVLALDSWEQANESLTSWIRRILLPGLHPGVRVVISGRVPLRTLWGPGVWQELIEELPLSNLSWASIRRYIALHGFATQRKDLESLTDALWTSTQGHPLALSLALAVARREGPTALPQVVNHPKVVAELTGHWLREIPDERLRELLEAAAMVRHFDQELLGEMVGAPVTTTDFRRLTRLSFVRGTPSGWAVHPLVRRALAQELRWRAPIRMEELRHRALASRLRILSTPARQERWSSALADVLHLVEDALLQAVFFGGEEGDEGLLIRPATLSDLPELEDYFRKALEKARAGPTAFEVTDPASGLSFSYTIPWVDFLRAPLDLEGYLRLGPGVVRMARDARDRLRGLSVVLPVNAHTLPYLESQPVTGAYFRHLSSEERAKYAVPPEETAAWYIRHINTLDLTDAPARAALFRDLIRFAFREGCLITSSPVPFFQDLLRRCGFTEVAGADHCDFGEDFPSPTYLLDLRGPRLGEFLRKLAGGKGEENPSWHLLTPREREVALAVAEGISNREIALRLGITLDTVKRHLTRVYTKLGILSRTQLVRVIFTLGVGAAPQPGKNAPSFPVEQAK